MSGDQEDQWVRDLPAGTAFRDPFTGRQVTLSHHTDFDDGWWLTDGSWLRWHHAAMWIEMHRRDESYDKDGEPTAGGRDEQS